MFIASDARGEYVEATVPYVIYKLAVHVLNPESDIVCSEAVMENAKLFIDVLERLTARRRRKVWELSASFHLFQCFPSNIGKYFCSITRVYTVQEWNARFPLGRWRH